MPALSSPPSIMQATTATTRRNAIRCRSGRRVRSRWLACSISCCTTGKTRPSSIQPVSASSVSPLGGYTGLVLAGAHADFRRLALFCKATDKGENCERARSGDVPPSPQPDPRIRAAVLADAAMTFAFTPEGLSGIRIPLQIWRSELGGNGVGSEFDRAHRQRTAGHAGNPHRSSRPLYVPRAVLAATRGGRAANLHRRACELRQNGLSP